MGLLLGQVLRVTYTITWQRGTIDTDKERSNFEVSISVIVDFRCVGVVRNIEAGDVYVKD